MAGMVERRVRAGEVGEWEGIVQSPDTVWGVWI